MTEWEVKIANVSRVIPEKPPASAHFNSKSYIYLKLNQGLISAQDEVELLFKTRLGNGLIFYAGDNVDYISIYLVSTK